MPSPQKVAWSQLKVDIMALVALVILAVLVFLMTGANNPFSEKFILYAFFPDSVAMTDGSAVRLNGILVGKQRGQMGFDSRADFDRNGVINMRTSDCW